MMLSQPDDDIETTYYNLIIITEEVALAMLPRKRKEKQRPLSAHGLVKEARRTVHKATHHHANKPTRTSLRNISRSQEHLDQAYTHAEAE